ncbi:unnamed protein product [Bursaphelenchus xylophilus]|uniref:(pine wood nematode) hypothetical protein n=1 Tax=Bursaphelenchus xylophilus TaxID=6326 RepID=A0A1I7SVQ6_BURXY|nr:unnamed protein product [Bursaphelenchus xylophilus]CAG9098093.1 unnamed protein product [Bursaphelenchus xylophilus]
MKAAGGENVSMTSNTVVQAKAIGQKRLKKELEHFSRCHLVTSKQIQVENANETTWNLILSPMDPPYNEEKFKMALEFHPEYPFKPPRICFVSPIYHPNVNSKGEICLTILAIENWKPGITVASVMYSLISLLRNPEPERGLVPEIITEYLNNNEKFIAKAREKSFQTQ